jgi:hypothetical protein
MGFQSNSVKEALIVCIIMSLRGTFGDRREPNATKQSARCDAEIASSNESPSGRFVLLAMTRKMTWSEFPQYFARSVSQSVSSRVCRRASATSNGSRSGSTRRYVTSPKVVAPKSRRWGLPKCRPKPIATSAMSWSMAADARPFRCAADETEVCANLSDVICSMIMIHNY